MSRNLLKQLEVWDMSLRLRVGIIAVAAACIVAAFLLLRGGGDIAADAVFINDAVMVAQTPWELTDKLNLAFEEMSAAQTRRSNVALGGVVAIIVLFVIITLIIHASVEKNILNPFRSMQSFARRVATGDLDTPLEMDKHNHFGAFTESFDLMRDELRAAKEGELRANQAKKELVASLSHDIKTPVASIKAVVELMTALEPDEATKQRLASINAKAEQIDGLITNMFHATLEELQALKVEPVELQSTALPALIHAADYLGQAEHFTIKPCIVLADPMRLQQVFDNIITNSYKYAGTAIKIDSYFEDKYLIINIQDLGPGVPADDLPLITNKFYRGQNAKSHTGGYGLGLYLSKYFIEKMGGLLDCQNAVNGGGLKIKIKLRLC